MFANTGQHCWGGCHLPHCLLNRLRLKFWGTVLQSFWGNKVCPGARDFTGQSLVAPFQTWYHWGWEGHQWDLRKSCDLVNGNASWLSICTPGDWEKLSHASVRPGLLLVLAPSSVRKGVTWKDAHKRNDSSWSRVGRTPLMEKLTLSAWTWHSPLTAGSGRVVWGHWSILGCRICTDESQETRDKWDWPRSLCLKQQQIKLNLFSYCPWMSCRLCSSHYFWCVTVHT